MSLQRHQPRIARTIVGFLVAGFVQLGISAPGAEAATPLSAPTITSSSVTSTSMTLNLQTSGFAATSWRYIVTRRVVSGCANSGGDTTERSTSTLDSSITITGLTEGCYYTIKVAGYNGSIGKYAAVEKLVNGYFNGLKGYHKEETTTYEGFTGVPFTSGTCSTEALTSVYKEWGSGGPSGCANQHFTSYFVGYLKAPHTGSVTFRSTQDDGIQLNIQGQNVLFGAKVDTSPTGSITMVKDEIYRIEIWFHEYEGGAAFYLDWEYGSQARIQVPTANLGSDPSVFFGTCPLGLDPRCAAGSALEIKRATSTNMDGHYWILINGTATLVYCVMNSSQGGGGWMLAMRGKNSESTFTYNSSYWVNNTLLNENYPQRFKTDAINTYRNTDAKYAPFTSVKSNQIMVLFPEYTNAGGIYSATNKNQVSENYGFSWSETITTTGSTIAPWTAYSSTTGWGGQSYNQGLTGGPPEKTLDPVGSNCISAASSLTTLFLSANRCAFRQVSATWDPNEAPYSAIGNNLFYSQNRIRFFGINYGASSDAAASQQYKARIGFGWNETVNDGADTSNDGGGGIGTYMPNSNKLAAGSYYGCCATQSGVASGTNFGFELYVRNTVEITVSGRSVLKVTQGRSASYVAGSGYYPSNNTGTTTFRLSSIRDGFTIDPTNGVVTVSEALPLGTYTTTVTAGDANNASGTRSLSIQVVADSDNVDQAIKFNGTSQYLRTSGTIGLWASFTYEAWIRPRDNCSETGKYRAPLYTSNVQIACEGGFWWVGIKDSSALTRYKLAQRVVAEEWVHLAVVRNGTTVTVYYNNIQMKIYVGSIWVDNFTISTIASEFSQIYVGGTGTANEYFDGQVDEVKIWNNYRSLTDIWKGAHEAENLGSTNLLMYWDFNETTAPLASRSQPSDANFDFTEFNAPDRNHIASIGYSGPYIYMTFPRTIITKNGGFQMHESVTALSVLVLGGGGGGGGGYEGGGGGAGGYVETTLNVDELAYYPVRVGVGGLGATNPLAPSSGDTSTAFGASATGGGRGSSEFVSPNIQYTNQSGGSGGGGSWGDYMSGGAGISGQGFNGGTAPNLESPTCSPSQYAGGGGGGATSAGFAPTCFKGGDGGTGLNTSISNYYASKLDIGALAAGGGGSTRYATSTSHRGLGGSTSAGNSAYISNTAVGATGGATNAKPTTGSGGGAGMSADGLAGNGGSGGSGVVIFRYIVAKKPTFTKPTNAYLNVGMTETFTTNVATDSETAQLTRTFRWESSTTGSNGTFSLIKQGTGAANAAFSWVPPDTSTSGSNFVYRVIVTDSDTAGLFIVDTSTAVFATINGALKLVSKSSLSKTVNISKSETFTVSSGTPTYSYSLMPVSANFTLDTSTVGSPVIKFADNVTVGTYYETFTVIDSVNASITVPLTITVNPPPSFSANAAQVDAGSILYLDAGNRASYPGSGGTWSDISGRGLTASFPPINMPAQNGVSNDVNGDPTLVCSVPSYSADNLGSLVFNGLSTCGYISNFGIQKVYTYELWVKRSGSSMGDYSSIISNPWSGSLKQIAMTLHWRYGTKLQAGVWDGYNWDETAMIEVADQTWTHVAVTFSGTSISLIINGDTANKSTAGVTISWRDADNNDGILIGKRFDSTGSFFDGAIASIRGFDRVLSDPEILQNYNATRGRFVGTQNKQALTGKYGTTVNETYTVTAGSETVTATFTANALAGIVWDTTTARSIKIQLRNSLSAGTYLDTLTVTDIYGANTRIPLRITISKADTVTVYVDTPTALSYTGSAANFTPVINVNGLVSTDTGTATSVAYKPGGASCATGGTCSVGDIGPGGGIVFITPATASGNGRYFEAAPSNWTGSDDTASVSKFCIGNTDQDSSNRGATNYGIGWGETNTGLFEWSCIGGAVDKVASYTGGGFTDWFMPNSNELIELAKVRTQAGLIQLGSSWTSGTYGYWGSTEDGASAMRILVSVNGAWNIGSASKSDAVHLMVRPVRMFDPCWAVDTCTAFSSTTKPKDAGDYSMTPSSLLLTSGTLDNYEGINYLPTTLTISKISQRAQSLSTYSLFFPDTMTIGTYGGDGTGALSFAITGSYGAACTLDWRKLGASAAGSCTVQVTKAADRNYNVDIVSTTVYFMTFTPMQAPLPPATGSTMNLEGFTPFDVDATLAPSFTGLSASSGAVGSSLTISGVGFYFADISKVTVKFWRGVQAVISSIPSDSTINVTVPTGATTGRIIIITPNGMVGTTTFTVTP